MKRCGNNCLDMHCDHIALCTDNAARLEKFYVAKLGFVKERDDVVPMRLARTLLGIRGACLFIRLFCKENPALKIELFEPRGLRTDKRRSTTQGYNHWGLCTGNREVFCKTLKAKGVRIIKGLRGGHTVYFIKDPDGNRIEIRD